MSAPLRTNIIAAISAIAQVDPKSLIVKADPNKSPAENISALAPALNRVKAEIRLHEMQIDDLRAALGAWADLTRKMTDVARDREEAACEDFCKKNKTDDWLTQGLSLARELRNVERDIDHALTLERYKLPAPVAPARAATSSSSEDEIELERGKPIMFDGSPDNWLEFKKSFEMTVMKKHPSDVIRMYYLKRYLADKPKKVIAGFGSEEFKAAWDTLADEYWDKSSYVRRLHYQLSNLRKCTDLRDLKRFQLELNRLVRQLTLQGEDIQGDQTFLALERKVPKPIARKILERKLATAAWSTKQFCETLNEIVKQEARLNALYENDSDHEGDRKRVEGKKKSRGEKEQPKTVAREVAFVIEAQDQKKKSPLSGTQRGSKGERSRTRAPTAKTDARIESRKILPCTFCEGNHFRTKCPVFDTFEKKLDKAKQLKLCFNCLHPGHLTVRCDKPRFTCKECKGSHNTALCNKVKGQQGSSSKSTPSIITGMTLTRSEGFHRISPWDRPEALLMAVQGTVYNPSRPSLSTTTWIFLDPGSTRSFVTQELANELQLDADTTEWVNLIGFNEPDGRLYQSHTVNLGVKLKNETALNVNANCMPMIVKDINAVQVEANEEDGPYILRHHLKVTPQVLIGVDHFFELEVRKTAADDQDFTILESRLGPIACGNGRLAPKVTVASALTHEEETSMRPEEMMHAVLRAGLEEEADEEASQQDLYKKFADQLCVYENRFLVGLLWNHRASSLPSNYRLAKGRLRSLIKTFKRNPELYEAYRQTLDEQLRLGIIEVVDQPSITSGIVHYLPHQPVWKVANGKLKLRIVYDGSAKCFKVGIALPSLNDALDKGPLLLRDLTGVLMRLRRFRIAIIADIEKAFLQLTLLPSDRDSCRFLWIERPLEEIDPEQAFLSHLTVYRFRRVSFGLNCSPFLLNGCIRELLNAFPEKPLAQHIMRNIYVDNVAFGCNSEEEVITSCREAMDIFQTVSMPLREFCSNAVSAIRQLPDQKQAPNLGETKLLGLLWKTAEDELVIRFPALATQPHTKRQMLSHIASVFDPMGIVSPALLQAKLLLSQLWELDFTWDETVPQATIDKWKEVTRTWNGFRFHFKRTVGSSSPLDSLQVFADASGQALGVAVYLVNSSKGSSLVLAKSLVKPKRFPSERPDTIPRLELHALAIAVRLARYTLRELDMDERTPVQLWTDSTCSIDRLRYPNKYPRAIENLIKKVRNTFPVRHVRTNDNPADIASRGLLPEELSTNSLWMHGPGWLAEDRASWPEAITEYFPGEETLREPEQRPTFEISLTIKAENSTPSLFNFRRFSKLSQYQRTSAYLARFLVRTKRSGWNNTILKAFQEIEHEDPRSLYTVLHGTKYVPKITANELELALQLLIFEAQSCFPVDDETARALSLFENNALLLCGGRVQNSQLPECSKHPIFLPKTAEITGFIILDEHLRAHHSGIGIVLAKLRQRFWIMQARRVIKSALYTNKLTQCMICKRDKVKPYRYPEPPPLPALRVRPTRPFTVVGVDYFGPIRARIGSTDCKTYGVIFTCLCCRAIHLECTWDLSTTEFLRALRRLISRRGVPKFIYSDNGAQLVAARDIAEQVWTQVIADESVRSYAVTRGIQWSLIPPRSPWRGGFYERIIAIIKKSLRRVIGRKILEFQEINTLLCEVETVVNQRPITYQPDSELIQAVTPQQLLIPYDNVDTKFPIIEPTWDPRDPNYGLERPEKLLQSLKFVEFLLTEFWKRWQSDYLLSLRERETSSRSEGTISPQIGDIVLLEQEDAPRSFWRLGKITELGKSRDNQVRTANLWSNGKSITRSVNQLYPLEIEARVDEGDQQRDSQPSLSKSPLPKLRNTPPTKIGRQVGERPVNLRPRNEIKMPKRYRANSIIVQKMKKAMPTLMDVERDGNCLYRTASMCLLQSELFHKEIRTLEVDYINLHLQKETHLLDWIARYLPGFELPRNCSEEERKRIYALRLEAHAHRISRDKEFAGFYDVILLSKILSRRIARIFRQGPSWLCKIHEPNDDQESYMARPAKDVSDGRWEQITTEGKQLDLFVYIEDEVHWRPFLAFDDRYGTDHLHARFAQVQQSWQARLNNLRAKPKAKPLSTDSVQFEPKKVKEAILAELFGDDIDEEKQETETSTVLTSTPPISAIEEIQLLEEEGLNGTIVEERISNDQDALKLFGVSRTAVRIPDMTKLEEKAASHNKYKWQRQYRIPSRPGQEKAEQEKAEKIAKERAEKMAEALIDSLRKKDGCSSSQLPNINQLGQRILMATEKKQSRKTEVKRLQSFNISEGGIRICESALLKALKSQKQSIAESLIEKARSPSERREKKRQALVEQIPRDDPTTMKKEKSALKKQERERQCIAMNKMKDKIEQLQKQLEQRDPQKSMHYHRDRSRSPIRRSNDRKDHHRFKSDPNRNESPRKRSREADRSRSKRRSEGDKKSTQTAITEGPPTEPKEGKLGDCHPARRNCNIGSTQKFDTRRRREFLHSQESN